MPVINITEKSVPNGRAQESMPFALNEQERRIPKPSNEYEGNSEPIGTTTEGRNQDVLTTVFPLNTLGLDTYDPYATYQLLLAGGDDAAELALGKSPLDGAEAYMGENYGTTHLNHALTPNLADVDFANKKLNIPNPYVPDVSAGTATAADYAEAFEARNSGVRNSFPPVNPDGSSVDTGLDLSAGDGSLNPSDTAKRLGSWTKSTLTLGRWTSSD